MQLNAAGHAASQVLKERFEAIAQRVTSLYFEAHPLLAPRWKGDRQEFTEDNRRHLAHLGEALFGGVLRCLPNTPPGPLRCWRV